MARPRLWSEEDQAWVEMPPRPERVRRASFAGALRGEVTARNRARAPAHAHELTRGAQASVIYGGDATGGRHGNFIEGAYRRMLAHPAWFKRLSKVHTARRQARPTGANEERRVWRELDTATSSDALLMNVFCYPRVLAGHALPALLGVEAGLTPIFGYRPGLRLKRGLRDRTEIDMRLGTLLVEAKLTEGDFQTAPLRLIERYVAFEAVFDRERLSMIGDRVRSYQLLRGVLAAEELGCGFAVLADARRPDLREAWREVLSAVRGAELRTRLRLHTWQEVVRTLPGTLRRFLGEKYGIEAGQGADRTAFSSSGLSCESGRNFGGGAGSQMGVDPGRQAPG